MLAQAESGPKLRGLEEGEKLSQSLVNKQLCTYSASSSANHSCGKAWEFGGSLSSRDIGQQRGILEPYLGKGGFCRKLFSGT